nr:hypothetical protein [Tanacetum cinerariifolium]
MSSPNHLTFDIEDAFSSNSPDYTLASPDYFPASPRNTSFNSLNNSYSLVPIASPTLSLFHDDPYMKVMNAYDTIMPPQVPIPPLIIVPQSLVMAPKRTSTSVAPAMNQAAIRQLIDDRVAAALEAQAANMANTDNTNRNPEPRETPATRKLFSRSNCTEDCKVKFATGAVGLIRWFERNESVFSRSNCTEDCKVKFATVKKMEDKFYNLVVKGNDLKTYARRFQELAVLCQNIVPNTEKHMEVFIGGLPRSIEGNVTDSKPQTFEKAININQRNTDNNIYPNDRDNENHYHNRNNNNYQNNCDNNYNNRYNDHHQHQNIRQEAIRAYTVDLTKNSWYAGNLPLCRRCRLHHT